jgi:hypothetical protein
MKKQIDVWVVDFWFESNGKISIHVEVRVPNHPKLSKIISL